MLPATLSSSSAAPFHPLLIIGFSKKKKKTQGAVKVYRTGSEVYLAVGSISDDRLIATGNLAIKKYRNSSALNSPTPRNMLKTPPKDAETKE